MLIEGATRTKVKSRLDDEHKPKTPPPLILSKLITLNEVCKSFTDDQLIVLSQVFMQQESEVAKIVKSYVIYKVTFGEDEPWED